MVPEFLIKKLKKEYPNNPSAVYGTLNNLGMMHGSKETPKGVAAQAKHERDIANRGHKNIANPGSHVRKLRHG